jgi:hypothetical protein
MKKNILAENMRRFNTKNLSEQSGPTAEQLNAAKVYFYGLHLKASRGNFSPYGIKLLKSIDGNNLTYSVWSFGKEEIITIPAGVFTSAVSAYKSEGNNINDAFIHATENISRIEDHIKDLDADIDRWTQYIDQRSVYTGNKSMSEMKRIVASSKKAIKYHNEIIKDIKSLK